MKMKEDRLPDTPAMLLVIIGLGCSLLSIGGTLAGLGAVSIPIAIAAQAT